jgi:hypothetical protein
MATCDSQNQAETGQPRSDIRIGIDFDGTIADTNEVKAKWIRMNLGVDLSPWSCDRSKCVPIIGLEKYEQMAAFVYGEEGTGDAAPVTGALDGLRCLAQRAWLYVVTNRFGSHLPAARRWLCRHGVANLFKNVVSSAGRTKGEVCWEHGIEVLLDDDLRHTGLTRQHPVRVVLLARGPDNSWEPDAICVKSWSEFVAWTTTFHGSDR